MKSKNLEAVKYGSMKNLKNFKSEGTNLWVKVANVKREKDKQVVLQDLGRISNEDFNAEN